VKTGPQATN